MNKVLLTGASGFIGRHCLPGLVGAGYKVHAITGSQKQLVIDGVTWHQANLLDLGNIQNLVYEIQPTHLLHLAWHVPAGKWATTGAKTYYRWIQSSLELLRAFHETGGRRVVMTGSCTEYDWRYGYCTESLTPVNPNTVYGQYKKIMHDILHVYSAEHGLSSAWGRVFFLYGPYENESRLVPSVINSLLNASEAKCTEGKQIRDFLYVEDVADALVALLDSEVNGPVNIASGKPIALNEIIFTIADMLERRDLVRLGALPTPGNETPFVLANAERLFNEVGWKPACTIETGLRKSIEWWKRKEDNKDCG